MRPCNGTPSEHTTTRSRWPTARSWRSAPHSRRSFPAGAPSATRSSGCASRSARAGRRKSRSTAAGMTSAREGCSASPPLAPGPCRIALDGIPPPDAQLHLRLSGRTALPAPGFGLRSDGADPLHRARRRGAAQPDGAVRLPAHAARPRRLPLAPRSGRGAALHPHCRSVAPLRPGARVAAPHPRRRDSRRLLRTAPPPFPPGSASPRSTSSAPSGARPDTRPHTGLPASACARPTCCSARPT